MVYIMCAYAAITIWTVDFFSFNTQYRTHFITRSPSRQFCVSDVAVISDVVSFMFSRQMVSSWIIRFNLQSILWGSIIRAASLRRSGERWDSDWSRARFYWGRHNLHSGQVEHRSKRPLIFLNIGNRIH